jgi:hypothetical protein
MLGQPCDPTVALERDGAVEGYCDPVSKTWSYAPPGGVPCTPVEQGGVPCGPGRVCFNKAHSVCEENHGIYGPHCDCHDKTCPWSW